MAYSARMAAALSGATLRQLAYWRRQTSSGSVLVPETSTAPRVLYSFRDLLALRTFVRLRERASLQKIRKAISNLRDLGEVEHLSEYTLVAGAGSIQMVGDEEVFDLVKKPGQRQVIVAMGEILEPFPIRAGVVVPHLLQPRQGVSVDPATRGGHPVITGTRVPYELVAGLVEDGVPPKDIREYYPSVSPEAAEDAADFALYVDSYDPATRVA